MSLKALLWTVAYLQYVTLCHMVGSYVLENSALCSCLHLFFTLPAGAFAKYCDEYICHHLCVCLSVRISPEPHGWSLPNVSCMLPMAVSRE